MKPLSFTVSSALVALALAVATPSYGQGRPGGEGGGGGGARPGGEGGGGGHAVSRGESGGGGSMGGSVSGSSSGAIGGATYSGGSGSSGGGHSVYRPSPDGDRSGRPMGTRGPALGRLGSVSEVGDPGQRAVPRGGARNDGGNPIVGAVRPRTANDPRPPSGNNWYNDRYYNPNSWYYGNPYSWGGWAYGYYNGYWGHWWPGYGYYGYYDPFWWGLNYYGYNYAMGYEPWVLPTGGLYGYSDDYRGGGGSYKPSPQDVRGPRGGIKLKVKPVTAEVWVDGYFQGIVDDFDGMFQYLNLPVGQHRVEVKANGYQTLTFDTSIQQRDVISYRGELQPVK